MTFTIETRDGGGTWKPLPYTFDSQSQAEQFLVNEIPETTEARITPRIIHLDSSV